MSYCPSSINFSEAHSSKRMHTAAEYLGETVVKRLLAFALFLMGAKREDIARHLSIPLGTLLSLLSRITRHGLPSLEDRRRRHADFLPPQQSETPVVNVTSKKSETIVNFGNDGPRIVIAEGNHLQRKVFLLTLVQNGLLNPSKAADLLGYSASHTTRRARQLADDDVYVLLDKREGQKQDYRITPEMKAELIQQFTLDTISRGKTSGDTISSELKERCQMTIPSRTVRHHLAKLGLPKIKHSLPQLLDAVKKSSKKSP